MTGENLPALIRLIQDKLGDGRLPNNSIPRIWGGPGNEEKCDACEETIPKAELVMEGINTDGIGIQFHVRCFYLWDSLRQVPGRS